MKDFYQQDLHKCLMLSLIKLRVIFQTEAAELIEADASEIAFDFDYDWFTVYISLNTLRRRKNAAIS